MPHYLVPIRGDRDRAAGRLALAGIQNVMIGQPPGTVAARLSAESPERAVERVRGALEGEAFEVGEAHPEPA